MATLVLKSTSVIRNPRYGKLPDLDTGLRFALDARELRLGIAQEVSRWVASRGNGSTAEKTFSGKNAGMSYPYYTEDMGIPNVKFDKIHQLFNENNDSYFVGAATYVFVGKMNNLNPPTGGIARIFCGDTGDTTSGINSGRTSDQYQHVAPWSNGLMMATGGATTGTSGVMGQTIPMTTDYFVGVFVFNGQNSKMMSSQRAGITTVKLSNSRQDRVGLGIGLQTTDHQNSGFEGYISYLAQYDRAFTDAEMQAAINYFKADFNI